MEVPAKVPNEAVDWQAVDIFVFTNGQQHSPPRKYHLSAQELNWWRAILRHLARSQYGSLNSTIDLYSVEGKKLEGPLELINGAAYVAVKQNDQFIDTGYSKYLIKASRSWEKRKVRRSSSIEILKPAECSVLTSQSNGHISTSEKKTNEENVSGHANTTVNSNNKVIEGPHTFLNVLENPHRDSSLAKYPEKKKLSPIQRSSILRKTNAASVRKDSLRSKDTPIKNSKGLFKKSDTVVESNNVGKSKIPQKTVIPSIVPASESAQKENNDTPQILNISEATVVTDVAEIGIERDKEEALFVTNIKNTDNESQSMTVPFRNGNIREKINNTKVLSNITEQNHANEPKVAEEIYGTQKNVESVENEASSLVKDLPNHETITYQTQREPNVSFAENSDNNYLVINNGGIVHLKLQVEFKNAESAVNGTKKNLPKMPSSIDDEREKESQINNASEFTVQNKSLQTIYVSDNVGFHRNSGVLVVKCACCQENANNTSRIGTVASPNVNDSKLYVMLLPNPELQNNLERYQCHERAMNTIIKNDVPTSSSIYNPVKKQESVIALEILSNDANVFEKAMNEQNATKTQDVGCAKNASENKSPVDINENRIMEMKLNEKDGSKNNIKTFEIETNEYTTMILANAKQFLDKSTQTELCSLLLEARHHEDGRYSFHLPPLDVLKYYKY